ncbi:hypothetical protein [Agrobacterium rosae]|uniref:Pentapeptide repeat-containing protein n=1 Tax=Agrobacterium rosae TaxID=1972867 RepID=A0AAW9F7M9_9HYPH|nr:hypothetical protein [Agrobacterium rosae]MDX8301206.1 hypothetical protein [Agrobacterium rosae]
MSKQASEKGTGDWPVITENHWYALAITSAIFTTLAILAAFLWIFFDGFDGETDLKKAQAVAPFGVALFALVTFCTVAWRGSVNVRQANQAEREGRAKLLQEGAKLLGEAANPSHVSAGIATLEILITGPDEKLAIQAMNLVADFVQREMQGSHHHPFREEAFASLSSGASLGRRANRSLTFDCSKSELGGVWFNIDGVKWVSFKGGSIMGGVLGGFEDRENYRYSDCDILMMDINLDSRFTKSKIKHCNIKSIDFMFYMKQYAPTVEGCDFSGAVFDKFNNDYFEMFSGSQNYYSRSMPPTCKLDVAPDWSSFLDVKN